MNSVIKLDVYRTKPIDNASMHIFMYNLSCAVAQHSKRVAVCVFVFVVFNEKKERRKHESNGQHL